MFSARSILQHSCTHFALFILFVSIPRSLQRETTWLTKKNHRIDRIGSIQTVCNQYKIENNECFIRSLIDYESDLLSSLLFIHLLLRFFCSHFAIVVFIYLSYDFFCVFLFFHFVCFCQWQIVKESYKKKRWKDGFQPSHTECCTVFG